MNIMEKDKQSRCIFLFVVLFLIFGCNPYRKEVKQEKEILGSNWRYSVNVKKIQEVLRDVGFYPGAIDGQMGWQTREAVKAYQGVYQLKESGYVDSETWGKLKGEMKEEVNLVQPPIVKVNPEVNISGDIQIEKIISKEEVVKKFRSGSEVKKVQQALINAGYNPGVVDGRLGKKTKQAIVAFQRSKGLYPDGIVGPKTWSELDKYFSQNN